MTLVETIAADLDTIRNSRPLIHSITNFVVMNETANAVLCIGALPIMSHAIEEVEEMVEHAGALVLNIGTLTPNWVRAMELAGKRANQKNIAVVLDPVGAGATTLRTDSSKRLLENVKVSVIRGNAAEVGTLAGVSSEIRGVESIGTSGSVTELARKAAHVFGCTVAITGVVDVVSDGTNTAEIANGHELMSKVVGTGCMSDVIVGSFAAVQPDPFTAAAGGLTAFGAAGEMAAQASGDRPGTFHVELYNALHAITPSDIESRARIKSV